MTEISQEDRPLSEQYRIVGKRWVDLDGAARMAEECKGAVLAQRKKALGDIPDSHAEKEVKASDEWLDYLKEMVSTRTKANLAKVQLEYIKMKSLERSSSEANARHEFRITR